MIPVWIGTVLDIVRELARRIPVREKTIVIDVEKTMLDKDGKEIPRDQWPH